MDSAPPRLAGPRRSCRRRLVSGVAGFGLLEAIIACGLIVVLAAGVAQLTLASVAAVRQAGERTTALLLAVQKMEQMRSLAWSRDLTGSGPVSDLTTDLTVDPPGAGGAGLRAAPADSLDRDVPGYVDYLDGRGVWVGAGARPPSGAAFVRRWSVRAAPGASGDLLALDVVVLPLRVAVRARSTPLAPNVPGVVWLSALKGRR